MIKMRMPKLASVRGQTLLTDNKPYLFRQSPVVAEMLEDMIVGGTVAWNQLVRDGNFTDDTHTWQGENIYTSLSIADGIATVTLTSGSWNVYTPAMTLYRQTPKQADYCYTGHKYIIALSIKSSIGGTVYFGTAKFALASATISTPAGEWVDAMRVVNCTGDGLLFHYIGIGSATGAIGDSFQVRRVAQYDLTQMFGSQIADYVYSLETQTAGSGLAFLKSFGFFTEDYYPYDSGSLLSVKTSGHKVTGKNLAVTPYDIAKPSWYMSSWLGTTIDGDWINQQGYSISIGGFGGVCFYNLRKGTYTFSMDVDATNAVDQKYANTMLVKYKEESSYTQTSLYNQTAQKFSRTFTLEKDAECVAFRTTSNGNSSTAVVRYTNIQIELGSTATTYEPYESHTYPLSDIELRGIPKLVNNELQYDGDTYASNGTVTRKYVSTSINALTWTRLAVDDFYVFATNTLSWKNLDYDFICSGYVNVNTYRNNLEDKQMGCFNNTNGRNRICIRDDAYSSVDVWLAVHGTDAIVANRATPTTESADPFTNPQQAGSTEEYIDTCTVPMPVGHETQYFDMVQKEQIQMHMGQAQAIKMHMPKGD